MSPDCFGNSTHSSILCWRGISTVRMLNIAADKTVGARLAESAHPRCTSTPAHKGHTATSCFRRLSFWHRPPAPDAEYARHPPAGGVRVSHLSALVGAVLRRMNTSSVDPTRSYRDRPSSAVSLTSIVYRTSRYPVGTGSEIERR